jgi:hypothetical protein
MFSQQELNFIEYISVAMISPVSLQSQIYKEKKYAKLKSKNRKA